MDTSKIEKEEGEKHCKGQKPQKPSQPQPEEKPQSQRPAEIAPSNFENPPSQLIKAPLSPARLFSRSHSETRNQPTTSSKPHQRAKSFSTHSSVRIHWTRPT